MINSFYYIQFVVAFLIVLFPLCSFGADKREKEITLVIARHGETNWNKQKIAHGCTDIPLNNEGVAQAKQLGERLKEYRFKNCYCSDLSRAKETAMYALRDKCIEIQEDKRLRERDLREFEGKSYEEIWQDLETALSKVESDDEIDERLKSFLSDLYEREEEGTVSVVSHNGWIRAFFRVMFGFEDGSVSAGNCGYFEVKLRRDNLEIIKIDGISLPEGVTINSLKSDLIHRWKEG